MMGLYHPLNSSAHMDFSRADISPAVAGSPDAQHPTSIHFEPHSDDKDMCTPKYFVFNSQVRWGGRPTGVHVGVKFAKLIVIKKKTDS